MAKNKITYSEVELVALLKENSEAGFSYLYDNYSSSLYTIIIKIIKDEEKSNDILQEVFIKIWKNKLKYNPDKGRLFTWMLNITRNAAIDYSRLVENKIEIQDVDFSVYQIDKQFNTDIELSQSELGEIVNKLRPDRKILIDMAYFEGYTHEEIAEKLNLPLGTIKTRIRSGLQELRKYLSILIVLITCIK